MKKRMKIWLHFGTSSDIKEISVHKLMILLFVCLNIAGAGALGYFGMDYYRLKQVSFDNSSLNRTIDSQTHEIHQQRKQVQIFAQEIEVLKQQVDQLSKLEDKVRLIADIKKESNDSGLIGIGGIPENNLIPDIPVEERHDAIIREMHRQVKQTEIAAGQKQLDFEDLIGKLEKKKNILAATPSIRPVNGWITSRFGYRKSPFTGKRTFHSGLDISNATGTKIVATADGKISFSGKKMYYGNIVTIDHGFGKETRYAHCHDLKVKKGQQVKRGDVIATVGNTGQSTGPHLHYEVRVNGTPVNPLKYILN